MTRHAPHLREGFKRIDMIKFADPAGGSALETPLYFNQGSGEFRADYEGKTYASKDIQALRTQLRDAAAHFEGLTWTIYIHIDWEATKREYSGYGAGRVDSLDEDDGPEAEINGLQLSWQVLAISDCIDKKGGRLWRPVKLESGVPVIDKDTAPQGFHTFDRDSCVEYTPQRYEVITQVHLGINKLYRLLDAVFGAKGSRMERALDKAHVGQLLALTAPTKGQDR